MFNSFKSNLEAPSSDSHVLVTGIATLCLVLLGTCCSFATSAIADQALAAPYDRKGG